MTSMKKTVNPPIESTCGKMSISEPIPMRSPPTMNASNRQLDYRSNHDSRRYRQREPECIFHVRFR